MRTVFFGTPEWAVPSLAALLDHAEIDVAGVVTNPDRPAGRGMELRPSPVKEAAVAAGLEVRQPEKVRDPELHDWLRSVAVDVATVVAYGKILPASLLEIPPLGFVNVHFSILPEYRGAAPVQRAVMEGVDETGVSIMVLTEGMDEGPILGVETTPVGPEETAGDVGERLASVGGPLLARTLIDYGSGASAPVEQDHSRATYASKITTDEARIDWSRPTSRVVDHVRGLNPVPGAWTELDGARLKVHRVASVGGSELAPGAIATDDGIVVGTGDGAVGLVDVQLAGRKRMSGDELARGLRLPPGASFQ